MAATQTWVVNYMTCLPTYDAQTDVVYEVGWSCFAQQTQDGVNYTNNFIGTTVLQDLPGDPFTPYSELTQEQVLSWIWASDGVDKDSIERYNQDVINGQITPTLITPPLPWQ
jgi:hypothetical protein